MAKAYKPLPAADELWELFDYKPLTGQLVRRRVQGRMKPGDIAGTLTANGYVKVAVNTKQYYAHRLVYMWVTGNDPYDLDLDHADANRTNNCFWNLRTCTRTENNFNRKAAGYVRVGNRYYARICVGGRQVVALGGYATPKEAEAAYKKAALQLHGEFARV
jgi:hypothetical protein